MNVLNKAELEFHLIHLVQFGGKRVKLLQKYQTFQVFIFQVHKLFLTLHHKLSLDCSDFRFFASRLSEAFCKKSSSSFKKHFFVILRAKIFESCRAKKRPEIEMRRERDKLAVENRNTLSSLVCDICIFLLLPSLATYCV